MYWEVENGSEDITFHVCLINYSRAVCEFTKVSSFQLFFVTTGKTSCSMSNITVLITVKMIILQEPAGTPSSTEKPFTLKPLDGSSTISNFCSMNKRAERMEDWTIEFNHVFFFFPLCIFEYAYATVIYNICICVWISICSGLSQLWRWKKKPSMCVKLS